MIEENVEKGEAQNDGSDTQNVKTEQVVESAPVETNEQAPSPDAPSPDAPDLDVTGENSVVEEEVVTQFDPDEKILSDMLESGKAEVTTNELIQAGFDSSRMASYSFQVGGFKLSRLLLVSPYKIEKTQ